MADVTKRFRWGVSVENILDHFTTPEINALRRHCRKLIRDFCNLDLEGEGYRCTRIPFEMFHYGFVLAYDEEGEHWALEVLIAPDFGDPDCPRKRPRRRKDGGARRKLANDAWSRRPRAWLERRSEILNDMLARAAHLVNAFCTSESCMRALVEPDASFRSVRVREYERTARYIRLFNAFAEEQSQGCRNLVQLVRLKVNEALSFIGPLSSYPHYGLRANELWDSSLFGEAEPASG